MPIDYHNELDRISSDISAKVIIAYSEVTEGLMELTAGKSAEETAIILDQINIENLMAAKLTNVRGVFDAGIKLLLEDTFTTSFLTEQALEMQMNLSWGYLSQEFINGTSAGIRQELISGILNGLEADGVIKNLSGLGFDERHLRTQVITGYNQYGNSITNMMADKLPDNAQFVYIGAYDDKTRDACADKIRFSPASKKDILKRFGNLHNEVWNCRHKWEEITNDLEGQGFEKDKAE